MADLGGLPPPPPRAAQNVIRWVSERNTQLFPGDKEERRLCLCFYFTFFGMCGHGAKILPFMLYFFSFVKSNFVLE